MRLQNLTDGEFMKNKKSKSEKKREKLFNKCRLVMNGFITTFKATESPSDLVPAQRSQLASLHSRRDKFRNENLKIIC